MSSSIAIPTAVSGKAATRDRSRGERRDTQHPRNHHRHHLRSMNTISSSPASSSSSMSSMTSSVSPSPSTSSTMSASASPSRVLETAPGLSSPSPETQIHMNMAHTRRPSLLSSAISKEEAHVINIGDPDGPPRLISYLASSQGFTWNPEIFVPSYVDYDYTPLENWREPVIEIFLSDEEIEEMMPK